MKCFKEFLGVDSEVSAAVAAVRALTEVIKVSKGFSRFLK